MKARVIMLMTLMIPVFVSAGWHPEIVDGSSIGLSSSVSIDINGFLHIVTIDAGDKSLIYIQETNHGWKQEPIPGKYSQAEFCRLQVDPLGYPQLCYYDAGLERLCYAYRDSVKWYTEPVCEIEQLSKNSADITLDSTGNPHILFNNPDDLSLWYAWRDTHWQLMKLDAPCQTSGKIAMGKSGSNRISAATWCNENQEILLVDIIDANPMFTPTGITSVRTTNFAYQLDQSDQPHIVYDCGIPGFSAMYCHAIKVEGQWISDEICSSWITNEMDMTITDDNQPGVVFAGANNHVINVAQKQNNEWHHESIDTGYECFIQWDPVKKSLRTVHSNASGRTMRTANQLPDGNWHTEYVMAPGEVGYGASLAIDQQDTLYISYIDHTDSQLKLAMKPGHTEHWLTGKLPTNELVSEDTALAVDETGAIHIIFYSSENTRINYGYLTADNWWHEAISPTFGPALNSFGLDLVLDSVNQPHCMYASGAWIPIITENNYIFCEDDSWDLSFLDVSGGNCHDLVVDSSGDVHILTCENVVGKQIQYTRISGNEIVETEYLPGHATFNQPVITIDSNNTLHAAYSLLTSDHPLKYAKKSIDAWEVFTVDQAELDIQDKDIAVDSNGQVHICYCLNPSISYSHSDSKLYYATGNDASWQVERVDCQGNAGRFCSLVIDSQDVPHIAYYNGHLAYAVRDESISSQSPTPTPQPHCENLGCKIRMSTDFVHPGEIFSVNVDICCPDDNEIHNCPIVCVLEIMGELFWAPSFNDFDLFRFTLKQGLQSLQIIPEIYWPDDCGRMDDLIWHTAILSKDYKEVLGQMDSASFSYSDQ